MSNRPLFVISLDFELYWGMFDTASLAEYGENIRGVHTVIPEILRLFEEYDIHATWATVGMLMAESKTELLASLPPEELKPTYTNQDVSSYVHLAEGTVGNNAEEDPYHFGAALVKAIIQTLHQELGSHTFSHYYVLDGSENSEAIFAADCDAFSRIVSKFNIPITSLVFPRNQINARALQTLAQKGFTTYRGTPKHILYTAKQEKKQTNPLLRLSRLIDAYINISGHHTYTISTVNSTNGQQLFNVPASRFLRPYSRKVSILEPLRIARIKNSMTYAAKRGEVFHLWWHPHNFGTNRKENLSVLTEILQHYAHLQKKYGMQSVSMREAATHVNE